MKCATVPTWFAAKRMTGTKLIVKDTIVSKESLRLRDFEIFYRLSTSHTGGPLAGTSQRLRAWAVMWSGG